MTKDEDSSQVDRSFHNKTASVYDDEITSIYRIYHEIGLKSWVERLPQSTGNAVIGLDIGTGTGVVALKLTRKCQKVIGLDHSTGMLQVASKKAEMLGLSDPMFFVNADCHNLPFPDSSFDVVTIQGTLHHFGSVQLRPTVSEIARVVKLGGRLYVSEPCVESNPLGRLFDSLVRRTRKVVRCLRHPFAAGIRILGSSVGTPPAMAVGLVGKHPDEGPICSKELLSVLREFHFETSCLYLVHLCEAISFPEKVRLVLTKVLSLPFSRTRGDIVFVYGIKR